MQESTILDITRFLSTIENVDRILVMEAGRIVEEGEHSDLISRNGAYSRLHTAQSLGHHPIVSQTRISGPRGGYLSKTVIQLTNLHICIQ